MTQAVSPAFASTGAINVIGALLEQRTGQQIAANRMWRIETALTPILRANDLYCIDQLIAKLTVERNGPLTDSVVDALLNQETSFFRDGGVFDAVVAAALTLHADFAGRRLRIWCAGCATGQEPYSLAMLFHDACAAYDLPMPEIVATDVSTLALARARVGRYTQFEIQRGLPVRRMLDWFEGTNGEWFAKPALTRLVQYRQHNLTRDPAPIGRFDIVLCRNVLLYFSASVRAAVFETLHNSTRDGGLLVLGAGETVIGQTDAFRPSAIFRGMYRANRREIAPPSVHAG